MKESDLNHLRRLLDWIGTKIRQEGPAAQPDGAAETYASRLLSAMTHRKIGVSTLAGATGMHYQGVKQAMEGRSKSFSAANNAKAARFLDISPQWLATGQGAMLAPDATVPAYVVDAVKALEKVVPAPGRGPGVESAPANHETRTSIGFDPGADAGRELPLSDLAVETGLAEIGITAWGPRAEDWVAGAEYAIRLLRECLPQLAAESRPSHVNAAGTAVACRATPAAPPPLRGDDAGGAGAARRSTAAHGVQEEQADHEAAARAESSRSNKNMQVMQEGETC